MTAHAENLMREKQIQALLDEKLEESERQFKSLRGWGALSSNIEGLILVAICALVGAILYYGVLGEGFAVVAPSEHEALLEQLRNRPDLAADPAAATEIREGRLSWEEYQNLKAEAETATETTGDVLATEEGDASTAESNTAGSQDQDPQ